MARRISLNRSRRVLGVVCVVALASTCVPYEEVPYSPAAEPGEAVRGDVVYVLHERTRKTIVAWAKVAVLAVLLGAAIRCWDAAALVQSAAFLVAPALALASRSVRPIAGAVLAATGTITFPGLVWDVESWMSVAASVSAMAGLSLMLRDAVADRLRQAGGKQ